MGKWILMKISFHSFICFLKDQQFQKFSIVASVMHNIKPCGEVVIILHILRFMTFNERTCNIFKFGIKPYRFEDLFNIYYTDTI